MENFKAVEDVKIVKRLGKGATWVSRLAWSPWKKQETLGGEEEEEDLGTASKAKGRAKGKQKKGRGKGSSTATAGRQRKSKSRAFLAYGFGGRVFVSPITMCLNSGDGKGSAVDQEEDDELAVVAGKPYVVGRSISDVHPVSAIAWAQEVNKSDTLLNTAATVREGRPSFPIL